MHYKCISCLMQTKNLSHVKSPGVISASVVQVFSGKLIFQNVDQNQTNTNSPGESVHTILISVSVISVKIQLNFIWICPFFLATWRISLIYTPVFKDLKNLTFRKASPLYALYRSHFHKFLYVFIDTIDRL